MIYAVIGAIASTFTFILVYGSIYVQERERYVGFWALGWAAAAAGLCALLVMQITGLSVLLLIFNDAFMVAGVLFILLGSHELFGRRINGWWLYAAAGAVAASAAGSAMAFPPALAALPVSLFFTAALIWNGLLFLRAEKTASVARNVSGWAFILWGLHKLDYPFLRSVAWFAPWGYMIATALSVTVTMGMLLFYFERRAQALRQSEARFKELANALPETVFEADAGGNLTFVNSSAYKLFGYKEEELERGFNVLQGIAPRERERVARNIRRIMAGENLGGNEYNALRQDGKTVPVIIHSAPIIHEGETVGLRGIIVDISARKRMEERLKFLSLCDPLTKLYNRTYFERQIRRLEGCYASAGIIICDVDGLKLVNDTLGHRAGDDLLVASADIIRGIFPQTGTVSRVGGDEFAVLLTDVSPEEVMEACRKIEEAVAEHNRGNPQLPLSLSVGYAISRQEEGNLLQLLEQADNNMYREKLHKSHSVRNSIVQTLMKALEARDFITERHAERLQEHVAAMARALKLPERSIADLRLLAQFHDIGKVGISDRILFKHGPLKPAEQEEMKRHSEIGFRIAQAVAELAPIADWILKHHEWWNGKGYPLGITGEEIPLECRILAIADAYDAMTNDRPYRKALSDEKAVHELQRWSGTQFDPHLVQVFLASLTYPREA